MSPYDTPFISPKPAIFSEFATAVIRAWVDPVPNPDRVTEKSSAPKDGKSLSGL